MHNPELIGPAYDLCVANGDTRLCVLVSPHRVSSCIAFAPDTSREC